MISRVLASLGMSEDWRLPSWRQMLRQHQQWRDVRTFQQQRTTWYRDLARAQDDGIALVEYLNTSIEREEEYGSVRVARVLRIILARLPSMSFAKALSGLVPDNDCMIIAAAELAGALPANLRFLAATTARVGRFVKALRTAIAAPLLPTAISVATLWYVATGILPLISEMIPPEKWTGAGALMGYLAIGTRDYGLAIAVLIVIAIGTTKYQLPRWTGGRRRAADDSVLSLYRDFNGALWLSTFALLLKAGVAQKEALEGMAEQASPWLRWHCNTILSRMVRYADNPGMAFDTGLLPRAVTNRMLDLAKRGHALAEIMDEISATILDDTEERVLAVANRIGFGVEAFAGALTLIISLGTTAISGAVT